MNHEHSQKLNWFLESALPIEESRLGALFSFVAIEHEGSLVLIAGKLLHNTDLWAPPEPSFDTAKVKAYVFHLSELETTIDGLVKSLVEGNIQTPIGALRFPSGTSDHMIFPIELRPFADGRVVNGLQISGVQRNEIEKYPHLDWAVKAGGGNSSTFHALLEGRGFDPFHGALKVDILDLPVVTFDEASAFDGTSAQIIIALPIGFETDAVDFSARCFKDKTCVYSIALAGKDIDWIIDRELNVATVHLTVPQSDLVECALTYCGRPQQSKRVHAIAAERLPRLKIIEGFAEDITVRELVSALDRDIDAGKPEAALDRLHAYCMRKFAYLLIERGEKVDDGEPLNSRAGRLFNPLRQEGKVSKMSGLIMKGTVDAFEAFNKIRNDSSLAHGKELLSTAEARYIFHGVENLLHFLKWIEDEHLSPEA